MLVLEVSVSRNIEAAYAGVNHSHGIHAAGTRQRKPVLKSPAGAL